MVVNKPWKPKASRGIKHHISHHGPICTLSVSYLDCINCSNESINMFFFPACHVSHLCIIILKIFLNRLVLTDIAWHWLQRTKQMFPFFFSPLKFHHCFQATLTMCKCRNTDICCVSKDQQNRKWILISTGCIYLSDILKKLNALLILCDTEET